MQYNFTLIQLFMFSKLGKLVFRKGVTYAYTFSKEKLYESLLTCHFIGFYLLRHITYIFLKITSPAKIKYIMYLKFMQTLLYFLIYPVDIAIIINCRYQTKVTPTNKYLINDYYLSISELIKNV